MFNRITRVAAATSALAAMTIGGSLLPVGASQTSSPAPLVLPIPHIPGVPKLPGPVAAMASPSAHMKILKVAPESGVIGTKFTVSGSGLAANTQMLLEWSTAKSTWQVEADPGTVNYLGRNDTYLNVVIKKVTTDSKGAFTVNLRAPNDWGGIHDIWAVTKGTEVSHGGFQIRRSVSVHPRRGPVGTPITVTYRGLGPDLWEGAGALLYDNHMVGEMPSIWTRGTATTVIRAAGSVGTHVIEVGDAVDYLYMNLPQSTVAYDTGGTALFRVTPGYRAPKHRIWWPDAVKPTVSQRTTREVGQVDPNSKVKLTLSEYAAQIHSTVGVKATGLTSGQKVTVIWSTVVGNRVNCTGQCYTFKNTTLKTATPSTSSLSTSIKTPDDLGGWHVLQIVQGGKIMAEKSFYTKISIVGHGVYPRKVKEGQAFHIHLKGTGWTQLDNMVGVVYDDSYVGYGCGFNSQGDVVLNLHATGGPGIHLIDLYPMLYTIKPSYPSTPYAQAPFLTYARDYPGLALGYHLPTIHLAIRIVK